MTQSGHEGVSKSQSVVASMTSYGSVTLLFDEVDDELV